jgi:hypothetical protein
MGVKTLNLNSDFSKIEMGEAEKKVSNQEMTSRVISNVILTYASQTRGLNSSERKVYYSINDTFQDAVKNKLESVELDDVEVGFIRKCFREAKLTPNDILRKVEEAVEAIKDR